MKTYEHKFTNGVVATLTADLISGSVTIEWDGERNDGLLPEYRRWMMSVYRDMASEMDKSIVVAGPGPEGQGEIWCVSPDGKLTTSLNERGHA